MLNKVTTLKGYTLHSLDHTDAAEAMTWMTET